MGYKARKIQDASSDDDAPEVLSRSTSQADAKRSRKALRDFEVEEKARRKARNREKDQKLKERARVTKGGKVSEKLKGVKFVDQALEGEEEEESGEGRDEVDDDVEARMLRAMRDAADEVESGEEEEDDEDVEFKGFGRGMDLVDDMASCSNSSLAQDEDDADAEALPGEDELIDPEAPTDDEEMDGDEENTSHQANIIHRPSSNVDYLADDLFAAAFASQNSKSVAKKSADVTQQKMVKKRRRKSIASPKELVVGYVASPRCAS